MCKRTKYMDDIKLTRLINEYIKKYGYDSFNLLIDQMFNEVDDGDEL